MSASNQRARPRSLPRKIRAALLTILPFALGCQPTGQIDKQRQIELLTEQVDKQKNEIAAQNSTIAGLNQQLVLARGLTPEDLKYIFYPESLVFASLTGGQDYDGKPGDDGVTVYLQPVDRDGDVLKVAGDIRVELYDLAAEPEHNRIGVYEIPVRQVSALWYGKFMTQHYTVKCPWPEGHTPRHNEITIRATFVDYLTRRVITAQTVVKVNLPPSSG